MRSRSRLLLVVVLSLTAVTVALSPTLSAFQGGLGGPSVEPYCGTNCHNIEGSALMTMWASNTTPTVSSEVTVIVNVTGGQADGILGVMLVSSKSPTDASLPTNAGWTILEDTSGPSADNYYEISNYAGSTSMHWKLRTPSTPDHYTLFARVMHGDAAATTPYFEDSASPILFEVGNPPSSGGPVVIFTSVSQGEILKGTVTVDVEVSWNKTISYAVLRLGDTVIGNLTSEPFSWTINTDRFADGDYTLNVTLADVDGVHGYSQINVSVSNAAINKELVDWVWTMAAGSIAILSWIGILIVVVLMVRRRTMKAGEK